MSTSPKSTRRGTLAFSLAALPFFTSAQLTSLSDEFNNAASIGNWQQLWQTEGWPGNQLEQFDVNTTRAGWAHLMPYTSTWFQDYRGVLVYKPVSGDFVVTTHVQPTNRAGTGAPNRTFSLGGIFIREARQVTPATWYAGGEDYIFLSMGCGNSPGVYQFEDKVTIDSHSTLLISNAGDDEATLQVARIGPHFILLRRTPASGVWTVHRRFYRPDLSDSLQVGMTTYTDWPNASALAPFDHNNTVILGGQPDLIAQFDYYRYARPVVPAALQGLNLSNAAAVTDAQLLTFLGANIDSTAPTATITRIDPATTDHDTLQFTIQFSEPIVNLTGANLNVAGTLAGTSSVSIQNNNPQFNIFVTPNNPDANGTLSVGLAGVIMDRTENVLSAIPANAQGTIQNFPSGDVNQDLVFNVADVALLADANLGLVTLP